MKQGKYIFASPMLRDIVAGNCVGFGKSGIFWHPGRIGFTCQNDGYIELC